MSDLIEYNKFDQCPYQPRMSEEWLSKFFKKNYYTKPYDRFMWWRSYTTKNKPLSSRASLSQRAENGDFDMSPFKFEIELVEHKLRKRYLELHPDQGRFLEDQAVNLARRKRLKADYVKDEQAKLDSLFSAITGRYGITRKQAEEEVLNSKAEKISTIVSHLEKRYKHKLSFVSLK